MIAKSNYTIKTKRLWLNPIELQVKKNLYGLWNEELVKKYFWDDDDKVITFSEIEEVITASLKSFAENGYGQWAIFLKSNRQFIGSAGLLNDQDPFFDDDIFPKHKGIVELIYAVIPGFRNKGYTTEVVLKLVKYVFKKTMLDKIVSIVDAPNLASIRVLEKSGMQQYDKKSINGQKILLYSINSVDIK
jgi:ribosomal-protein-alanine N-acetyltransferase